MVLSFDSALRSQFLCGGRLPTLRRTSIHGFAHTTRSKPCKRNTRRPIQCTNAEVATVAPPAPSVPETTEAETVESVPLHMETFSNYLDLSPQETTPEELVRLLSTGEVGELKSCNCPKGTVIHDVEYRILVFVSIVIQKMILAAAAPGTNNMVVMMNLLAHYNISNLMWDYMMGKLVMPDANSMNFRSPFAFIDTRVELDPNISPSDVSAYRAHLAIMAAKLAYENEERVRCIVRGFWNMEFVEFYNCWEAFQLEYTTQGFMMSDKPVDSGIAELVVVAFRGTDGANDACTDIDFSWYEIPGIGKMHGGFLKALGLQQNGWPKEIDIDPKFPYAYYVIRERLREVLDKNPKAKFIVTGHSLGGALSALFPVILKYHGEDAILERLEAVYTFGQPRVGDSRFCEFAENILDNPTRRYFRYVYSNDMVPRVPFDDNTFLFKHFGKCIYFDSLYRGKELNEEPNENYFSMLYLVPMYVDAVYQFARSFTIGYAKGQDYDESLVMKTMRAMGLMMPGMPAHSPQDYNNITRLGTLVSSGSKE